MNILEKIAGLLGGPAGAAGRAIGNFLQPAKPAMPIQGMDSLTENVQPASGSVPLQKSAVNPMSLPADATIQVRPREVSTVDLSPAAGGIQPVAQGDWLQDPATAYQLQPAGGSARTLQPTIRGAVLQGTMSGDSLQKAAKVYPRGGN